MILSVAVRIYQKVIARNYRHKETKWNIDIALQWQVLSMHTLPSIFYILQRMSEKKQQVFPQQNA